MVQSLGNHKGLPVNGPRVTDPRWKPFAHQQTDSLAGAVARREGCYEADSRYNPYHKEATFSIAHVDQFDNQLHFRDDSNSIWWGTKFIKETGAKEKWQADSNCRYNRLKILILIHTKFGIQSGSRSIHTPTVGLARCRGMNKPHCMTTLSI
jgi:hypothetical protein